MGRVNMQKAPPLWREKTAPLKFMIRRRVRIARRLLLPSGVALVDCCYNHCSRQVYCHLGHRAVAVDHYCPHKAKALRSPMVATQTRYKFLCSMPGSGRSLQKGGNDEKRLACANKMQVPAISERVTRKLEEANDATSLGDVF